MSSDVELDDLDLRIINDLRDFKKHAKEWDELLESSEANTIFLSSAWISAWYESRAESTPFAFVLVRDNTRLVAAGAFESYNGYIRLFSRGDYADFIIRRNYCAAVRTKLLELLIRTAANHFPDAKGFRLNRVPESSENLQRLLTGSRFLALQKGAIKAPQMSMAVVNERLKKKSLIRHERKLSRQGVLICETTQSAELTHDSLPEFFAQHIQRWSDTPYPSLFLHKHQQAFFRRLTDTLAEQGSLRFSTVRLDNQLLAAHFGFHLSGVFTWYKPTYNIEWAKYSPGEVLLKHLLQQALEERAALFDFTIGNEAFKSRFATHMPDVVSLHLSLTMVDAMKQRLKTSASQLIRRS